MAQICLTTKDEIDLMFYSLFHIKSGYKSMKKKWPFKLGTTSFIYPDNIIPNVKKLGKDFDEIELLVFESVPKEVLPSKDEIKELAYLGQQLDITYNIHLPTDISFTDVLPENRIKAVDTIKMVMELCEPLSPTTHTLHLEFAPTSAEADAKTCSEKIKKWRNRIRQSLELFVSSDVNSMNVSIETLDYPFEYLDNIIEEYGLSVCIDAGHLIKYQFDIESIFNRYKTSIPLIHLHGVDFSTYPPKDHVSLDKTSDELIKNTIKVLKKFTGTLSLEVFSYENLLKSVSWLNGIKFIEKI